MSSLRKLLSLGLAIALLSSLLACGQSAQETPDTQTDSETESSTQTETTDEASTETDTATDTETETETNTETESESAPDVSSKELLTTIRFADLETMDHATYLIGANECTYSFTDDAEEGRVLALTAKSTNIKTADPRIHLQYKSLARDMGLDRAETLEFPHIVLKVKNTTAANHIVGLWGCASKYVGSVVGSEHFSRMSANDSWQYLYFDMSDLDQNMTLYRIDMLVTACDTEETILVSEMKFFATAEEALALAASSPDVYPVEHSDTLKIMSFNIKTEQDQYNRWPLAYRADMFRAFLDLRQPDVIGLQEDTPGWFTMLPYVFNDSYAGVGEVGDPRPDKSAESCSIYYRVDKFELLRHDTFWLSDTPNEPGSKVENANESRICTWVHLKDRVTGKEFIVLNTHLDHNGNNEGAVAREVRLQQMTNLLQMAYSLGDIPMVITGDFNQNALNGEGEERPFYQLTTGKIDLTLDDGSAVHFPFSNTRVEAADVVVPNGTGIATMVNRHDPSSSKYDPTELPIDYVFYSTGDWEPLVYQTELYIRMGEYMSDHLPLYTELRLK